MSLEFSQLYNPDLYFGQRRIKGEDHSFPQLSVKEKVLVLALLDSCQEPSNMISIFGAEWIINRYSECAVVGEFIQEYAQEVNPKLAKKLEEKVPRKKSEAPAIYEANAVPSDYLTMLYPGSTAWGYAGSRILIEQLGREEEWKVGDVRFMEGSRMLQEALNISCTPIEFLVNLATLVSQPGGSAEPTAVLGHLLAVELENEGIYSQIREIYQQLKDTSSHLWGHYLTLTAEERKAAGILPIEVVEPNVRGSK